MPGKPTTTTLIAIALAISGLAAPTVTAQPRPSPTPVTASPWLPAPSAGYVSVPFSLAPIDPTHAELTLLTRWRTCGTRHLDDDFLDQLDASVLPATVRTAYGHVVESSDDVRIRVDVGIGPLGEPCEARELVRIPVQLAAPLGDRAIHDAGAPERAAVRNEVDSFDTGLRYSCSFGAQESLSVTELLGPGIAHPPGLSPADTAPLRVVRVDGDEVLTSGPVQPSGRVDIQAWAWRDGRWSASRPPWTCELFADPTGDQATATWRLRGKPPDPSSKVVRMWVREHVCNGNPLFGRVAQPRWINAPDGIVLVMTTMRDSVRPDGTEIVDPWDYYRDRPGVAGRAGGFRTIDCPGIGPAPYTVNLHRRLGHRKLYDGARFPPRPVRRAGQAQASGGVSE